MRTTRLTLVFLSAAIVSLAAFSAQAALTVTPITWNIIGLDSNDPPAGPRFFPVGARVCSNVATTNVSASFVWDSANPNVNLRAGSLSTINIAAIGAGQCADAYFEVEVTQTPAAFDTARRYHITAADGTGTYSSPTPRELYVEHLISQSRNAVTDVKVGTSLANLASVPAGGSMSLVLGNTYFIQLIGGTATQGYNQFEEFINFPNTVFRVLAVETTYSAENSPYVANPNDKLYADACLWDNDPNSPTYRSCVGGDFKAGGSNVVTTYQIQIIGGGGTSQTLGSLLYDFSGSSFHYNADFSSVARIANIVDPTTSTVTKSFAPNPTGVNGVSVLSLTIANPNPGAVSGYNFVDNLPANVVIAPAPNATTSGCGTPTLVANAGGSAISFSNGSVAANGSCVVSVNVTATATGSYNNTTNNLFIGASDTGHAASATLTVNNAPPPGPGFCGQTLAAWRFPTGFSLTAPAPTTDNIGGSVAAAGPGINAVASTNSSLGPADGTQSWGSNGAITPGATLVTANDDYFQFAINTTGIPSVTLNFDALEKTPNGPVGLAVFVGGPKATGASEPSPAVFNNAAAIAAQNAWQAFGPITVNSGLNPSGLTYFRIYSYNSGNQNAGSDVNIDNVVFTGCIAALQPTITKAFAPNPVAVNGVSTLTFTLTNPNAAPLTGAAFNDALPAGVQVAATPGAATTCGGTWTPAAGNTALSFTGGAIPAGGSCTVSVNVTAVTAGPHGNVSGPLSATESGTNTGSIARADLTALLPPSIAKNFSPSPVIPNGVSTLTFTITNPNQNHAISGVAFTDTFPVAPGAMVVAPAPNATTSGCGAPTFAPSAGAGSISFSGGAVAPGAVCTVSVNVTAPAAGMYNNTSSPVSHVINAQTVNGNTASDTLEVVPPAPSIGLLKQVGPAMGGPWSSFLRVTTGSVFYRFTVENTGDVPLSAISITDNAVDVSTCNATFASLTLPVAVAGNDNHIVTCIVGPVPITAGAHTNTAFATGTFNGTPYNSPPDSATYATAGLTLDKSVAQPTFNSAGDTLSYSYLVTNSGFAPLIGPVSVADNKTTVTCPAVTTVGDLDNWLDPGESVTCTATYIITNADVTNAGVVNTATATADGVNSNSDSAASVLSTAADVSLSKTLDTAGPYVAGQSVSYTITVANAGPATATNIQVTDTPTNLTITSVSGSGCTNPLPCTISTLASGANTSITITATITSAGAFDNSATATGSQPDPNTANNTDSSGNGGTAAGAVDVKVTKLLTTAGPYYIGQTINYSIQIESIGTLAATNIVVTDTPTNLSNVVVSGSGCTSFPCTIPGPLAPGASTFVFVDAKITSVGVFDNSVTVTPAETDANPANNTDNTGNGGTAVAAADVSLVKTLVTAGPYGEQESISYTLVISNAGPSTATNIQVTDTPTNLTITGVSGSGCTFPLPCTIASLASGASTTINVTASINAQGAFDNSATATAAEFDPNAENNTDNSGNGGTAGPTADVSVVKSFVTPQPYYQGDTITMNLLVSNGGPSTATNVVVTDSPTGLTVLTMSGGGCTGAVINGNPNQSVSCTIASLASGASVTVTVTARTNGPGQFVNAASVTRAEFDTNQTNNTSSINAVVFASADLSITKTLNTAGPYVVGQSITYTLVVSNAGPSITAPVTVNDTPTNLTITSITGAAQPNTGGGPPCLAFPCRLNPPALAATLSRTITVTATINAVGPFDNSATVSGLDFDPNTSNNSDSTGNGGVAVPSADVSLVKTLVTTGPFSAGQSVTYTLTVANAGPSTATLVQVADTPANLTITNVSGACTTLPCTISSLASGANVTITVTATINATGTFDNSATAVAAELDPNLANNTDNTGNAGSAGTSVDVSLVKTLVTAGPYTAGQPVSYTLTIANAGPSSATNIQVTDTPVNLTITAVSGSGCAALPCTIAALASGANTTINVTATITAAGAFDNGATATPLEPDTNSANNSDASGNGGTAAAPPASVDVAVAKTSSAPAVTVGTTFDYTVTVTNNGPGTATGVTVNDPLPSNFSLVSAAATQGSCSGTTAVVCSIGTMTAGATVTITIRGTVTGPGSLSNTATATRDQSDSVAANDSATAAPALVADIPTLSETALMLLGALLAFAGVFALRSRA